MLQLRREKISFFFKENQRPQIRFACNISGFEGNQFHLKHVSDFACNISGFVGNQPAHA
jgi:hypothetical protein